jgi:hypothetical protein
VEIDLTALFAAAEKGDAAAREQLFQRLYAELHRLARSELWRSGAGVSMGATTLLHEAFINMSQRDAIAGRIDRLGWMVGRTLPLVKDKAYTRAIRDAVAGYRRKVDELAKETPYAVPYKPDIWGAGWNIQQFGWDQWMLHLSFPDLFPRTYALQALSFILGVHPGSNTASFVSGVGASSLTTAYGFNRADWSHIPGGSASGTALIRPDFPELKRWPFFWQQTEYVLGRGTTDYLLLVLAADYVLNQ